MAVTKVVFIACVHLWTVTTTPVQRLCPVGEYLDTVTGRCEPCAGVCGRGVMSARQECALTCSDSTKSHRVSEAGEICPSGTYLDDKTLRCDSCVLLCREERSRECKTKCAEYLNQVDESSQKVTMLWSMVGVLSVTLLVIVVFILVKACHNCRATRGRTPGRRNMPYFIPYSKLETEKAQDRVSQWVSSFHPLEGDTDSFYSSKTSLIYTPPKTAKV